jgi:hypothetical protein
VLGRTPFKEAWRQAKGFEKVRLEHDGYRVETVQVPLDRGLGVTVTLKREHEPAAKKEREHPHRKAAPPPSKWEGPPNSAAPPKWESPPKPPEPVPI